MRIGHFIHQLNPFGTERVLAALLKYRSPQFADQFVVSGEDGPMRAVFERLGVPVRVTQDQRETSRLLRQADLVNLHVLHPATIPACLAARFPRPKIVTAQWAWPFPRGLACLFIATSRAAYELQPDASCCELIPNGIDLDEFPGHRVATPGRRVIARVCRPMKCDEFFWYGLLPVLADHPDTEVWLAGSEGPSWGRVRALGVLPNVAEALAASYLYVYTPRAGEGSRDLAVMEAMAMGLPCVLTDVPVVRESVPDESVAALVPFGDAAALEAALRRLLDDPEAAAALGHRARKYALAHFDVRPRVADYESAYRRAMR